MPSRRRTLDLWTKQEGSYPGDRLQLYSAIAGAMDVRRALYPGSFVDIAPSFVFPSVTYVDLDRRAAAFFADEAGVREIIARHRIDPEATQVRFIPGDYSADLGLEVGHFDLLISLFAGFVSESCTEYLRVGGALLVNSSHGDAAMASLDSRYVLEAAVLARGGAYRLSRTALETYLVPKRPVTVTKEMLHRTGRGVAYTRSPFAYLFRRTN